jgi:hypothetical protein
LAALHTHNERRGEPFNPSKGTRAAGAPAVYLARNARISGEASNASYLRQTERSVDANYPVQPA